MTTFRAGIKNMSWYATTFEGSEKISKMKLSKNDARLLFYILSKIDIDNRIHIPTYKELAKELNMKEATVKKAFMTLRNNDILAKDIEQKKTVFINPDLFYAGYSSANDKKKSYFNKCKQEYSKRKKTKAPKKVPNQKP